MIDRTVIARHLQRSLVPFLAADDVAARLAEVEAAGVLAACVDAGGYDLVAALNTCLFDHPAFFEARERRTLAAERSRFDAVARGERPVVAARYRVEHRIRLDDRELPDASVLQLCLPAPRHIPGFQRARLVTAEPVGLADHYLARAGQIYAAPFVVEAGRALPPLRLVYDVETSDAPWPTGDALPRVPVTDAAAAWAGAVPRATRDPYAIVASVLERLDAELQFALTGPVRAPVPTLLAAGAGDASMHAALLVEVLQCLGLAARAGAAQRLYLEAGQSHLRFPGAAGFDGRFVEWRDGASGAAGVIDLGYLGRWDAAATDDNASAGLRDELARVGVAGRSWLRHALDAADRIVAGLAGESRVSVLATNDVHWIRPPVDVELVVARQDGGSAA